MPTPTSRKIDTLFEDTAGVLEDQEQIVAQLVETSDTKDDDTRQKVAMWCVLGYFGGLVLILIGTPAYNYFAFARADQALLLDLKDTLLTYQAVVGTLIGAVVAYYFKTKLEKENK